MLSLPRSRGVASPQSAIQMSLKGLHVPRTHIALVRNIYLIRICCACTLHPRAIFTHPPPSTAFSPPVLRCSEGPRRQLLLHANNLEQDEIAKMNALVGAGAWYLDPSNQRCVGM